MKKNIKLGLLLIICIAVIRPALAEKVKGYGKNDNNASGGAPKAEACQPAKGYTDLDLNNVRARINTGGDMWWDLQSNSKYEIPKGSGKTSMYSGSLWMGGLDVNGQLKVAALRYRQEGNDFWPGPLTTDGTASIGAETCLKYDRHFKITRTEVAEFLANRAEPNPTYKRPKIFDEWPAHGDVALGQDYFLAPFFDANGDNRYNPDDGDYPYFNMKRATNAGDCRTDPLADDYLFGDMTLWWVFNDKGNIHTESKGSPIGFEIRAQAFAFSTNDEINNMTFYNYKIINRSTYTLTDTYFSQWVDTDLGYAYDDFVGCDVPRGLGYCYNGLPTDGNGKPDQYGEHPPAIGVDFFQGPYMDPDGLNNPAGIDEGINGVNFAKPGGDTIIDNERFGMRRFVYHNNGGTPAMSDPDVAVDYYNFLRGIWKDGTKMMYGGTGHISSPLAKGPVCDFMFPGLTDVLNWGTNYQPPVGPKLWTEEFPGGPGSTPNTPADRRFMQSAGPFTLKPGAKNYITVGIPWARTTSGTPWESVLLLKLADDKCQALFDNCFKIIDGPDAPDLSIREMDKTLILYLTNPSNSNNVNENYVEYDYNIKTPENHPANQPRYDSLLRFEGYQIYQLKDASASVGDIGNVNIARLVAQCDVKNNVSRIINFEFDESLGASVPVEKVNGENTGIRHSFKIESDLFATGNGKLVNHKKYYYVAIAYAYNNFKKYDQTDPAALDGQKLPYRAGRKSPWGSIKAVVGIPHIPTPVDGGTIANASYGFGPKIKRIEGQGNGGYVLDLTPESEAAIVANGFEHVLEYKNLKGPIGVTVVDPLSIPDATFNLKFIVPPTAPIASIDTCKWLLTCETDGRTWDGVKAINIYNEQIIPEIGLAITINQPYIDGFNTAYLPGDTTMTGAYWDANNGFLEGTLEFADSSNRWLTGIPDQELGDFNWIRSGTLKDINDATVNDWVGFDDDQIYEKILNGTIAPYGLTSRNNWGPKWSHTAGNNGFIIRTQLQNLASVDIVFTSDKSKWTRCPVIEMCNDEDVSLSEDQAPKNLLRHHQSIGLNGEYAPVGSGSSANRNDPNFISENGMGWFPGYAINIETGERLNMMFGENSWLIGDNGRDMKFNPTSNIMTALGQPLGGGFHYFYVMGHALDGANYCPSYDDGSWLMSMFKQSSNNPPLIVKKRIYDYVMWVGLPIPVFGKENQWLANDAKIRLRVIRPYKKYYSTAGNATSVPQNNNYPMYSFSTTDIATEFNNNDTAISALDLINIVPNPYYAFSGYEVNQLDNRVKIVNLPEKCSIKIYSLDGSLIRKYDVDKSGVVTPKKMNNTEPKTSIDWDLKNHAGIPISSGIYIIHINVEGVGEKVLKWFGTMRPIDLDSF